MSTKKFIISGATRIGESHVKTNTPNQDAYAYAVYDGDGVVLLAVADGAGSLRSSHHGAQQSVKLAIQTLNSELSKEDKSVEFLESAVAESVFVANDSLLEKTNSKDLGCTLTVVAITPYGWASCSHGDSFAIIKTQSGDMLFATDTNDSGEFANTTNLLGRSESINPTIYSGDSTPSAVAVSTDGLLRISVENNNPTPGFWGTVFNPNGIDGDAFLEFLENKGKLYDDTTFCAVVISEAE